LRNRILQVENKKDQNLDLRVVINASASCKEISDDDKAIATPNRKKEPITNSQMLNEKMPDQAYFTPQLKSKIGKALLRF
jgi:hypothetical protein